MTIEAAIEQKEIEYLSGGSFQGNHPSWSKIEIPPKKQLEISPKDKKFSLSSVFSRASLELLNIEDRRLTANSRSTFSKK